MNKQINVLLVGGTSFLGQHILQQLKICSDLRVQFTSRQQTMEPSIYLDLSLENDYLTLFERFHFDIVLWVSAIKDVQWCENNKALAKKINHDSLLRCYEQLHQIEKFPKFIFISSDYVFDGVTGHYTVASAKNPGTYYGQLKSLSEAFLLEQKQQDVIVRTSSLCGKESVFLTWLVTQLQESKEVSLFDNSYLTPTSVTYFSKVLQDLIFELNSKTLNNKILHICGDQRYSRIEFALAVKAAFSSVLKADVKGEHAVGHLGQDVSLVSSYLGQQKPHTISHLMDEVKECIKL